MLFEKNTLFGLLVLWFTGCRAGSPGHRPFCSRASISVPGAPASSLVTGSQVLVLNPGVEICAPDWVATALLCTAQPLLPRLEVSLAPVPSGELELMTVGWRAAANPPAGWASAAAPSCAVDSSQATVTADTMAAAQRAERERRFRLIAGHSCPAAAAANDGRPPYTTQLVSNLSEQTCQGLPSSRGIDGLSTERAQGQMTASPASDS